MGKSDDCLSAQSFALMHISYMLLHLHVRSLVNTSTENTNISAATPLETAFCYDFHATTECQQQWLLFLCRSL